MNKLITLLSLVLFLFAPTISAKNSNDVRAMASVTHFSEYCADEMNCAKAPHQCCVSHVSTSYYFETIPLAIDFSVSHRTAYVQYSLPVLSGVQTDFYRPPIL